jgi:hypothetical protein
MWAGVRLGLQIRFPLLVYLVVTVGVVLRRQELIRIVGMPIVVTEC